MAVFTSGRTIRDALKSAAQGCNLFPYPFELFPSHLHSSKLRPVQLVRWRTCWPAIPLELVGFKRGRAPDATGSAGALCDLLALGAGRVTNGTQTQARSTMMGGDRRGLLRPRQLVHPRRAGLRPIRPRMDPGAWFFARFAAVVTKSAGIRLSAHGWPVRKVNFYTGSACSQDGR